MDSSKLCEIFIDGDDGSEGFLIADLGLFHTCITRGNKARLFQVQTALQPRIRVPLRIVDEEDLIGMRPGYSGVPDSFTVIKGGSYVPEVPY